MINIKNKNLYYIGGVVRDEFLGKENFDIDLTYDGNAIDFCKRLEKENILKIIKINEPFGTVRVVIDNKEVDIASTRDEIYDKKGHLPKVTEIGCSLKQDVLRRDFTINSLAKSTQTGEIIDYTNGLEDLKNKKLRILYDESFIDDPTRIVRGLKFSVRFGFELEEDTKKLQENYLENINYDISYKRLKKELMETFNLNSQEAFDKFFNQKIYKLLIPKNLKKPNYNIENLVKKYPVENIWLVYLGWMNLEKLPLTKVEKNIIDDYEILKNSNIENNDFSIYKNFANKQKESILLYTIITGSDKGLRFFDIENIRPQITGKDIQNLGIKPSKKYNEIFDYVLKNKLKNPKITKREELDLVKAEFNIKY